MTLLRWLALGLAAVAAGPAYAAETDWPCIQVKVPELSPGTMWAGPPVDEAERTWREDGEIVELVQRIAPRRTTIEQATERIDAFAGTLDEDRDRRLTRLFAGLLHTIDAERKDIIAGIERYARKQAAVAQKIRTRTAEQSALLEKPAPTDAERVRIQEVGGQLEWEIRVFEERARSLSYVCESPVLLEQRLFALARAIMAHLE